MRVGKKEIARAIAKNGHSLIYEAEEWVEEIFETIARQLQYGDKVQIRGFGTFEKRHRVERNGYNPTTGERMPFDAYDTVTFVPSKELRGKMNE